jgi:hypothetical protein
MDTDLMLVTGIILGVLTIPSMLNAYSSGKPPRSAAIVVLIAGGLILMATQNHGGGYSMAELPSVFAKVFQRLR